MNDIEYNSERWYDNKWVPYFLIFFPLTFPIGIYALWKNNKFSNKHKIITTTILGIIALMVISDDKPSDFPDIIEQRKAITSFHPTLGPGHDHDVDSSTVVNSGDNIYVEKDSLGWTQYRTARRFRSSLDRWTLKENTTTPSDYEENYRERDQAVREIERQLREERERREALASSLEALQPYIDANVIVQIERETRTVYVNRYHWNSMSYEHKKVLANSATQFFDVTVRSGSGWAQFKDARTGDTVASYELVVDMLRLR